MMIGKRISTTVVSIIVFSLVLHSPSPAIPVYSPVEEYALATAQDSPSLALAVERKPMPESSRRHRFPWLLATAGLLAAGLVVLFIYFRNVDWPQYNDDPAIFDKIIYDAEGDLVLAPGGGPPTVIPYPAVDVTRISLGVRDAYLYVRVDLAGSIPRSIQNVNGDRVKKQSFNLGMDSDNDPATGASGGSDIVFTVSFDYGWRSESPYAWCDFSGASHDSGTRKIGGERRAGGPGTNFIVFRYKIADLGRYFPQGSEVRLDSWSEAKSSRYHHFAFDTIQSATWIIPHS